MKLKKVIALGMAVTALAGAALKVSAVSMKDIFDAKYYASKYSDLKEAFGDDEEKLYQHPESVKLIVFICQSTIRLAKSKKCTLIMLNQSA